MDIITQLLQGETEAVAAVKALVSQEDVNQIAISDFDRNPGRYTGATGEKQLADDTFNDVKHFLRGKIQFGADVAYQISGVRTYIRGLANQAAQNEITTHGQPAAG